jgi:hypothetical protein
MMAGPECRFVGGDIFDGAKAAFGNASATRQDAVNQQTGKTVWQDRLNILVLQWITI